MSFSMFMVQRFWCNCRICESVCGFNPSEKMTYPLFSFATFYMSGAVCEPAYCQSTTRYTSFSWSCVPNAWGTIFTLYTRIFKCFCSEKKNLFRSLKIPENTQTITLTPSNQAHIQNICLVSNNAFQTAGASIWKIVVFESEINSFFFWQRFIQTKIFSLLWTVWSLFLSGGYQSGRIISSHSIIQEFARSEWMGLSGGDQSRRINSSHSMIHEFTLPRNLRQFS